MTQEIDTSRQWDIVFSSTGHLKLLLGLRGNNGRTLGLSTMEAGYLAGTEATKEALMIRLLLEGGAVEENLKPGPLLGDNQSVNALAGNSERIQERQRFILGMVESGMIKVLYIYRQRK